MGVTIHRGGAARGARRQWQRSSPGGRAPFRAAHGVRVHNGLPPTLP